MKIDLESEDRGPSLKRCREEVQGQVKFGKNGDVLINNARYVQAINEKDRAITKFLFSSIRLDVLCPTVDSLNDLWTKYTTGSLATHLHTVFRIDTLREKYDIATLKLTVTMVEELFHECMKEIKQAGNRPLY